MSGASLAMRPGGEDRLSRQALLLAGLGALRRALARWRGGGDLDEAACQAKFGVGGLLLLRIEAGDVDPEPEVAERIWAGLADIGSAPPRAAPETRSECAMAGSQRTEHSVGARTDGAGDGGAAPSPAPDAAPMVGGAFLVNDAGTWKIGFWLRIAGQTGPVPVRLAIADARDLAGGIAALIAQHDLQFGRQAEGLAEND